MIDLLLTRARLHQMVWNNPRSLLAQKFGLSQAGLNDVCRENCIPVPPGANWVKPGASNQHFRARLPKREVGQNCFVSLTGDFGEDERIEYFEELLAESLEDLDSMVGRFRRRLSKINEAADPFAFHPEVAASLSDVNPSAGRSGVHTRRLNLLNEIFLYAEAVGGKCGFGGSGGGEHTITIGHVTVKFMLTCLDDGERLRLEMKSHRQIADLCWRDCAGTSLESMLPDIVVEMGRAAEIIFRNGLDEWKNWFTIASRSSVSQAGTGRLAAAAR